jgi:hypothetical protein
MNRTLVAIFLFLTTNVVFAITETDLKEAFDYAVASTIYWEDEDQGTIGLMKNDLGKVIDGKLYTKIESDTGLPEYFCVLPGISISNYVMAIHVWPQTKSKYSFEITSSLPYVNEIKNGESKNITIKFSSDWRLVASRSDDEISPMINKINVFFGKKFKNDGVKKSQVIYVGPFTKWSNNVYVYWVDKKTLYKINTAWFYSFDLKEGMFGMYSKIIWRGKSKTMKPVVDRILQDGKRMSVN